MTTAPMFWESELIEKWQGKNHRNCGYYHNKPGERLIVVFSGVISEDNKGLDYGYILRAESKLFVYGLDAERWVWETYRGQELH